MSQQEAKSKCRIPANRGFQRTNIASFTQARRQRFLSLRKQNRESYFERARKIALNADTAHTTNPQPQAPSQFDFSFHTDFEPDAQRINTFTQYPPQNDNAPNDTHSIQTDHPSNEPQHSSTSPSKDNELKSHKKKRKKKKKKQHKDNQQYRREQLLLAREVRLKYVHMFMVHEWMIDIPHDLTQNWLVGLRAEGERCLVFSHGGRTVSRNRTGNFIHHRFPSSLPAGNYMQQKKSGVTILDCIWIENIATYYVIDCILWSDQKIGLSDASMRLWFIQSKLMECWNIDTRSKYNKYRFISIETMEVTANNLQYLYKGGNLLNHKDNENENENSNDGDNEEGKLQNRRVNYGVIGVDDSSSCKKKWRKIQPDGFIFYHKHGCYVESVSCPLVLIWKDAAISRWFIDTSNRQNKNKLLQFVTLQLRSNATITTHERDVVLGVMTQENIKKYHFKPDALLRFTITNATCDGTQCKVDNLLYAKRASVSKMLPDSWSKIVFQHQAKHELSVRFEDIVSVATNAEIQKVKISVNDKDNPQNTEDELRTATLGLSNLHF